MTDHKSDCATHNAPAMEPGPCDCQAVEAVARAIRATRMQFGDVPTSVEHDTLPQAEARAAMAAMLDHMMTPSESAKRAGQSKMPVEVDYWQEGGMLHAEPKELYNCVQPETVFQAMLAQYRKENLDE